MPTNCSAPPPVHVSLGAYGRLPFRQAIATMIQQPPHDPVLGVLSTDHAQLCPQNAGLFSRETAAELVEAFPAIRWRLHANVRVMGEHRIVDLCDWRKEQAYFAELAAISAILQAPAYSAHAGKRGQATAQEVIAFSLQAQELFGIPVAIEGHYPTPRNTWLFSSWEEYRLLLESGAHYALDLSHLNILAFHSGRQAMALVRDLLACERCIEVHVSDNDGNRDQHRGLNGENIPWWLPLLTHVHAGAVIFSEGSQVAR